MEDDDHLLAIEEEVASRTLDIARIAGNDSDVEEVETSEAIVELLRLAANGSPDAHAGVLQIMPFMKEIPVEEWRSHAETEERSMIERLRETEWRQRLFAICDSAHPAGCTVAGFTVDDIMRRSETMTTGETGDIDPETRLRLIQEIFSLLIASATDDTLQPPYILGTGTPAQERQVQLSQKIEARLCRKYLPG